MENPNALKDRLEADKTPTQSTDRPSTPPSTGWSGYAFFNPMRFFVPGPETSAPKTTLTSEDEIKQSQIQERQLLEDAIRREQEQEITLQNQELLAASTIVTTEHDTPKADQADSQVVSFIETFRKNEELRIEQERIEQEERRLMHESIKIEALQIETERVAAEAVRIATEEAARAEAARVAAEEARLAAEHAAAEAARIVAEEAARIEAARIAEENRRIEAERQAAIALQQQQQQAAMLLQQQAAAHAAYQQQCAREHHQRQVAAEGRRLGF